MANGTISGERGVRFPTNRRFHENLNFFENFVSSLPEKEMNPVAMVASVLAH